MAESILVLDKVTKKYGDFVANDDISINFKKGEIHAILGENGAGKTTLMKTIYGVHKPNSGCIFLNQKEVSFKDSSESIHNGIGMVFQHFMLISKFTAVQNIILGYEDSNLGFINYAKARQKIIEISEKYSLKIDVDRLVEDLSVGMEQKIEILKVLYRNANIIIFDEPTAVLGPSEIDEFMNILKILSREGHTIILITHKIKEIKSVADRCTIMRLGKIVETVNVGDVDEKELTRLMIGKDTSLQIPKRQFENQSSVLEVKNLSVKDERGVFKVKNVNLEVRNNEIFGIAGIEGSGQDELIEAILGVRDIDSGDILKRDINNGMESIKGLSIKEIIDKKIGNIPSDRQKHGLILEFDIVKNIALKSFDDPEYLKIDEKKSKIKWLGAVLKQFVNFNFIKLTKMSNDLAEIFDIRSRNVLSKVKNLSGGNQQKVIVAREFNLSPDVLLAVQPTRGLDVGAIENIYKKIIELRNMGSAILLVSLELEELMEVCDRIAVMYNGEIVGVLENNFDINIIGKMMAGVC